MMVLQTAPTFRFQAIARNSASSGYVGVVLVPVGDASGKKNMRVWRLVFTRKRCCHRQLSQPASEGETAFLPDKSGIFGGAHSSGRVFGGVRYHSLPGLSWRGRGRPKK
mmetsp:Transcript_17786/g.47982  ORF Transcript_17786/g.47982 Transcript_17786/m.47982 type:complete len:109 (-) Transcript_17786:80-406(-)